MQPMSEEIQQSNPQLDHSPPSPSLERRMIECPQCHQMSAAVLEEEEQHASENAEIPDGLAGVSLAQCQRLECLYEFHVVTHRQILNSLRLWSTHNPHGRFIP